MYSSLVHLYKLKSPYDSIYIYVCSDWNNTYVYWIIVDKVNFDISN